MKRQTISTLAAAGLATLAGLPVSAAAAGNEHKIVDRMTPGQVVSIMQNTGYAAYVDEDGEGDPMILASKGGEKFGVIFFDCEKAGPLPDRYCTDLEFLAVYEVDRKPSLAKLNEWNANQSFGRAFLRDDGSVVMQMPINLAMGVSESFITSSLEWWDSVMAEFNKHL